MASKPTQRSLAYLRKEGWMVCVVEKFLPARGTMKFPRRIDAFGFGDLLACRSGMFHRDGVIHPTAQIALVQTTDASSFSKHKDKLVTLSEFHNWKAAGGIVVLHGWGKRGARGKKKTWTLREEVL